MLDINSIRKLMGSQDKSIMQVRDIEECLGARPSQETVKKVVAAFSGSTTANQLSKRAGVNLSTVSRALRHLRHAGDITSNLDAHKLTGSSNLLLQITETRKGSNTGVTGVSWNKKTKCFSCTYKRSYFSTFKTLLDAACKRKSLELNNA